MELIERRFAQHLVAMAVVCLGLACQSGPDESGRGPMWAEDSAVPEDAGTPVEDAATPIRVPTDVSAACEGELCWMAGALVGACGSWEHTEDFASGRYGVHAYRLALRAGVRTRVVAKATEGLFSPALLIVDETGATIHDGEVSTEEGPVLVEDVVVGRGGDEASLAVVADTDRTLTLLLTSWANHDSGFGMRLPTDASYRITVENECEDDRMLYGPPNFDPDAAVGGFDLLPPAEPSGLYTRRADGCSRGTKLLIDVIYTAALRWSQERPDLPALNIGDLNEGPCSSVDHATHDDGTHVDMSVTCGTQVSCADDSAAIALAQILVDTGSVCGILFNDPAVQTEVNAYFGARFGYEPWRGTFMRSVSGHTGHFHVRVKKPDGTCN